MYKLEMKSKGISLIALIITIIVIIILAVIVLGATTSTPESANKAVFLADFSEIQEAVAIKRAQNLMPTINNIEADMNAGFTKVMIKKPGESETEDGWVVNLDTLEIKNSKYGNGYSEIIEDTEITFGADAPDVYVYDISGEVYYAQGFKDGDNTIYSPILVKDSGIVEPTNIADWTFDTATGTISKYVGLDIETLVVPNYIGGVKVNGVSGSGMRGITYLKNVKNVLVSNGITSIGDYAFSDCNNLESVTIPDSVTSMGENVFSNSSNSKLTNVTLPNNITSIGKYLFYGCTSLASVQIPNSVKSIGSRAFFGCSNLTSIIIPSGVTSIDIYAFYRCSKLTSIIIPSGVTSINQGTFGNCTLLANVQIPNSVTSIASDAFSGCSALTLITINKADGSILGAPWGATNATVKWNE
jgi:hypothetical protein